MHFFETQRNFFMDIVWGNAFFEFIPFAFTEFGNLEKICVESVRTLITF